MSIQIIEYAGVSSYNNLTEYMASDTDYNGLGSQTGYDLVKDYDGTSTDLVIKCTINPGTTSYQSYLADINTMWTTLPANITRLTIDLNGHTWNPSVVEGTYLFDFTECKRQIDVVIENGIIDYTGNLFRDGCDTSDNFNNLSTFTVRRVHFKNIGDSKFKANFPRLKLISFYQCLIENYKGAFEIKGPLVGNIIMEDIIIIGGSNSSEALVQVPLSFTNYFGSGPITDSIIIIKRIYMSSNYSFIGNWDNRPELGDYSSNNSLNLYVNSGRSAAKNTNIPLDNTTFYSIDPSDPLYLVARPGGPLSNESVSQDSDVRIASQNTVGLNGVLETNGSRTVGCMSAPVILEEPKNITFKQTETAIVFTWEIPSTAINASKLEFYAHEYEGDFELTTPIAEATITDTTKTILYEDMPNDGNCNILLRYAL